jgi:hypothetical protein
MPRAFEVFGEQLRCRQRPLESVTDQAGLGSGIRR